MRSKKTSPVLEILKYANTQLARKDDYATREFKSGVSSMIDKILLDSGNYHGFNFLDTSDEKEAYYSEGSKFYDRFYHIHPKLQK